MSGASSDGTGEGGARELLTFGDAADLAEVALLDLRGAVRAGRLETRTGWQFGHPVDLIDAEDLAREFPAAAGAVFRGPSLAERGIQLDPSGESFVPLARQTRAPDANADDLRAAFKAARLRNEELVQQLTESGEQMRGLLERIEDRGGDETRAEVQEAAAAIPMAVPSRPGLTSIRPEDEIARLRERVRRLRNLAFITAGLALIVAGLGPWLWGGSVVAAPPEQDATPPTAAPDATSGAGAPDERAGEVASLQRETGGADAPERDPSARPSVEGAPDPSGAAMPGPEDVEASARPLAPTSDVPACAWHSRTGPDSDLRAVLGPCLGSWNPELEAVSGVHVHDGQRYCTHHLFFARQLGGGLAEQRDLARFHQREGDLAPLLLMRLDRAAQREMRDRTGGWLTSGFEALDGHAWTAGTSPGTWVLESWVQLVDTEGRRRFRLELELADGPHADHARVFAWAEGR